MTIQDRLLGAGSLTATNEGFDLAIRLPWYRSLPLSTIEPAELRINAQPIDLSRVKLRINGKTIPNSELPERTDEVWFVRDDLTLEVSGTPVKAGADVDVQFTLNVYPPYIPGMCWVTRADRRLRAR
jgi:Domain of unknown function (DUF6379)